MMKIQVIVIYKGQTLGYIEDFCGKEVLRIINPERRSLPDMTFVGWLSERILYFYGKTA